MVKRMVEIENALNEILQGEITSVYNLANIFCNVSKAQLINTLYAYAYEAGVNESALNAGEFLESQGKLNAAREWYGVAFRDGDVRAAVLIAQLCEDRGDLREALVWYRKAREIPSVSAGYARVARALGFVDEAEALLWHHKDTEPEAAVELVLTSASLAREDAITLLRDHWARGHDGVGVTLGNMLCERGDVDEALRVYRVAAENGDAYAAYNLGIELINNNNDKEGYQWILRAQEMGDKKAKRWLKKKKRLS